jgi:hypothetical protein
MNGRDLDHTLEFLLAFNGRVHRFDKRYWIKFEAKRIEATDRRPHGLLYSLTLHAPDGTRLIGFDNAHGIDAVGSRFKPRPQTYDHWHRTENDPGRPYEFKDAATLINDFLDEVERVLGEFGIPTDVVEVEESRRPR